MTRGEIRRAARSWLNDLVGQGESARYFSDEDLDAYCNEAVDTLVRKTGGIVDALTPGVCRIALHAGDRHIPLDRRIIRVEWVRGSWRCQPLLQTSIGTISFNRPGWEQERGKPDSYLTDFSEGYLTLSAELDDEAELSLIVRRMPLDPLLLDDDIPEIPNHYHPCLLDWMLYRALSREDTEVYNPQKAAQHLVLFQGTDELRPGGHVARILLDRSEGEALSSRLTYF